MNVAGNDAPASSRTCARRSISSLASLSFSADRRAISGGSASISLCMACTAPSRARTDCRNTHQLSRRALADVRTCCFARILACSRSAYRTDTSQCPRHPIHGYEWEKIIVIRAAPIPTRNHRRKRVHLRCPRRCERFAFRRCHDRFAFRPAGWHQRVAKFRSSYRDRFPLRSGHRGRIAPGSVGRRHRGHSLSNVDAAGCVGQRRHGLHRHRRLSGAPCFRRPG